jgi:hypothetical protein
VSNVHPVGTPETTDGLADGQRYQAYAYDGVGYPVHVPTLLVNTPLNDALPESEGATIIVGCCTVTDVAAAKDTTDPSAFVRDVATVTYRPASAATCVYVDDVAPLIAEQVPGIVDVAEATVAVQLYHCHVDVPIGYSAHDPADTVNTLPVSYLPDNDGAVETTGADCETSSAVAVTLTVDTLFDAVTTPKT